MSVFFLVALACEATAPGGGKTGLDTGDDVPVDADGDGSPSGEDCDDDDASRYPGASETCNELDDDCDGRADEEAIDAIDWYVDADADGYGAERVEACAQLAGWVAIGGDCDDTNPAVAPGAIDRPGDGTDGDCSGEDADEWACTSTHTLDGDLDLSGNGAAAVADAFCDEYNRVAGSVGVVGTDLVDLGSLDCLCEIGGDLVVADNAGLSTLALGADGSMGALARVGGEVLVEGNDALSMLSAAPSGSSALLVTGNATLESLSVGIGERAEAVVEDNPLLTSLSVWALDENTVGSLRVEDNPSLVRAKLGWPTDITAFEGDVLFLDNPLLDDIEDGSPGGGVQRIGGDLVVRGGDGFVDRLFLDLVAVEGDFEFSDIFVSYLNEPFPLQAVGGDLSLVGLRGNIDFRSLASVGGSVTFRDNDGLYAGWRDMYECQEADPVSVGGNLDITGNSDDAWAYFLCGLEEVTGDVRVHDNGDDVLTTPLLRSVSGSVSVVGNSGDSAEECPFGAERLDAIGGDLEIRWNGLAYGDGLGCLGGLGSVGGGVTIEGNSRLSTLVGLGQLAAVPGSLRITYNDALESAAGLEGLAEVGGSLFVYENASMVAYEGLGALESVGGAVYLGGGPADLVGLGALREVGGTFAPWYYADSQPCALTSLAGLDALDTVYNFWLLGCDTLASLDGAESLRHVESALTIESNAVLASVSALSGLQDVVDVVITDNPSLETADAEALVAEIDAVTGAVTISGNK